jgi:formylglycine-generating enzyme required for sulfatase activity
MKLMLIPPGEFMMGSTDEQIAAATKMAGADSYEAKFIPTEAPQHRVALRLPFQIGATEVTIGQFRRFVDATKYVTVTELPGNGNAGRVWSAPGYAVTDDFPVTCVNWNDAAAFCAWLSESEGLVPGYRRGDKNNWEATNTANGYRMLTEAEWEFACRAGTTSQFSFGDDIGEIGKYGSTYPGACAAVATKAANPFGLYEMHGNVSEWCQDHYEGDYYKHSSTTNPLGPPSSNDNVVRSGAWRVAPANARSAFRSHYPTAHLNHSTGFRIVKVLGVAATPAPSNLATSGTGKDTVLGIPSFATPGGEAPATMKGGQTASGLTPTARQEATRQGVPETSKVQEALGLVKEIFKDDYAKATKPEEKITLAEKLIQQAGQSSDDVAGRYAMLSEARRLAIDAGETKVLERAVAGLAKDYDVVELDLLVDSWDELLKKTRPSAATKAVAEAALAKVEQAADDEDFETAGRLTKLALDAARKSKDNALIKQVSDRDKALATEKQQWEALQKTAATLAEKPDDPAANLAMGRHLCFVQGDWEQGLPMLVKGGDATLKDLAAKSLANPTDAAGQSGLGDAWWTAAEAAKGANKSELQIASRYWYAKALPALTGLAKVKVEQRLQSLSGAVTKTLKGPKLSAVPAKAPFSAQEAKALQVAWAKQLRMPVAFQNRSGMALMLIPPGEFSMGSSDEQIAAAVDVASKLSPPTGDAALDRIRNHEGPQHRVAITRPFLIGATEVTVGQFKQFVAATKYITEAEKYGSANTAATTVETDPAKKSQITWAAPGTNVNDASAVSQVSWNDAAAFCNWLSELEKLKPYYQADGNGSWTLLPDANGYHLPTEAQWEYACRAGSTTHYTFGDDLAQLEQFAWFAPGKSGNNNLARTVGLKLPNAFGLHDIHGNLLEWCQDFHDGNWYKTSPPNDPTGPQSGGSRVVRGGSWFYNAAYSRSAFRWPASSSSRHAHYGFRCARDLAAVVSTPAVSSSPARRSQALPSAAQIAQHFLGMGATVKVRPANQTTELTLKQGDPVPAEEFAITEIHLSNNKLVSDSDMAALGGLPALRVLFLNGTRLTDLGIAQLSRLTGLETINLSGMPQLTDQTLAALGNVTSLKSLVVHDAKVTDAGLVMLKNLTNLWHLSLAGTQVNGAGFDQLTGLQEITDVNVANTPFNDQGMARLRQYRSLRFLDIGRTQVSDAGMTVAKELMELTNLHMARSATSDVTLGYLVAHKKLQRVVVGARATDAGIAALQKALPTCKIER